MTEYMVRVVRNPYEWGSGDLYSHCRDKGELAYTLSQWDTHKFPDLDNQRLKDQGYPGYPFLSLKVYEVKEIEFND